MPKPYTILIKRVDNLGDVIFILPIVKVLKRIFPKARFILMVKKEHRGILYEYSDEFLSPRSDKWVKAHTSNFNKVINIAYEIPKGYKLSGITRKQYVHLGVKKFKGPHPVYHKLLLNLKGHGVNVSFRPPEIFVNPLSEKQVSQWLVESGLINQNHQLQVTIDPGSSFAKKCWPLIYFVNVCKWLVSNFNAHLLILGAQNDKRISKLCQGLNPSDYTMVAGKPIGFVAALMSKCHLHIGNDSGLGHVAAALNIPTVTVFGPTAPHLWRPAGKKAITVYNPDIECEGGYEHAFTCKMQQCLFTVKPGSVADAVIASINLFIRPTASAILDEIRISKYFVLRRQSKGVVLSNVKTGHSCLVLRGWNEINQVIKEIKKTGSFSQTLQSFPKEKLLLNMLLVHRIVVPAKSEERQPFL